MGFLLGGPVELGASRHASSREQRATADSRNEDASARGESAGTQAGGRAELVDATQYDFERLERAVGQLVEQQAQLLAGNDALREQIEDRERTIHRLESELDESNGRRRKAMERLDALICELDRLDDGLERSLQARGDTPAVDDGSGQAVD